MCLGEEVLEFLIEFQEDDNLQYDFVNSFALNDLLPDFHDRILFRNGLNEPFLTTHVNHSCGRGMF